MPIDMSEEKETIPAKTVYNPQSLSGEIPVGKTLKIETSPDGVEILTAEASNGKALKYTITVSLEEVE